jgi:hypothetical protein
MDLVLNFLNTLMTWEIEFYSLQLIFLQSNLKSQLVSSNHGLVSGCPDCGSSWFSSVFPVNFRDQSLREMKLVSDQSQMWGLPRYTQTHINTFNTFSHQISCCILIYFHDLGVWLYRGMGWILDLLTQFGTTGNYSATDDLHKLQFTTAPAELFPACCVLTTFSGNGF